MGDQRANVLKAACAVLMTAALASCASSPISTGNRWKSYPNGLMREAITCPAGMQKMVKTATYLELFRGLWKDQPEPASRSDIEWPAFRTRAKPYSTGESGKVLVSLLIGKQGQVMAAHVICSTNPVLDEVALQAAMNSQYRPARVAGAPVMGVIKRPYNFVR